MWKLIRMREKTLYSSNKNVLICWDKNLNHSKILNLCWRNSRWKLNFRYKYIQTDISCTKLVVGLCYIFIILAKLELCSLFKAKQSTCQVLNIKTSGTYLPPC